MDDGVIWFILTGVTTLNASSQQRCSSSTPLCLYVIINILFKALKVLFATIDEGLFHMPFRLKPYCNFVPCLVRSVATRLEADVPLGIHMKWKA